MTAPSQRKWGILLAIPVVVVLTVWWGATATVSYHSPLTCCCDDPGTGGGLGLVLWARQLGIPVMPLREPLWEAAGNSQPSVGNCYLTAGNGHWSPWAEDLQLEQWASLRNWITRGNTLIVLTSTPEKLPDPLLSQLKMTYVAAGHSAQEDDKIGDKLFAASVESAPKTSAASIGDGRSLTVREDGPRWSETPPEWQVAGDARGSVWHRMTMGQGAIYLVLDDYAWTNSGLDAGENAAVLAGVLKRELRGGVFGIDEYRHGHGRVESFVGFLLQLPGARPFFWMCAVVGGWYFIGRNIRFGPPEPYRVIERRTSREYVDAVAHLYERARAVPLAVESVIQRFRYVALQRRRTNRETERALKEAEQTVAEGARPANPSEACENVRALVALRKEFYGS